MKKTIAFLFIGGIVSLGLAACSAVPKAIPSPTPPANQTPQEVVQSFYSNWIDQANRSFLDDGPNPLAARSYRESPFVTIGLIQSIDQQLDAELSTGGADPFLCAQDVPAQIDVISTVLFPPAAAGPVLPPSARVLLKTSFSEHYLQVRLLQEEKVWKIDQVSCNLIPTGAVESFYTWYLGAIADPGSADFHNPIVDGSFRSSGFLSTQLIADVDATLASFKDQSGYDPFLMAQNTPLDFYVEQGEQPNIVILTQVWGNTEQKLKINLIESNGRWLLDSIQQK